MSTTVTITHHITSFEREDVYYIELSSKEEVCYRRVQPLQPRGIEEWTIRLPNGGENPVQQERAAFLEEMHTREYAKMGDEGVVLFTTSTVLPWKDRVRALFGRRVVTEGHIKVNAPVRTKSAWGKTSVEPIFHRTGKPEPTSHA